MKEKIKVLIADDHNLIVKLIAAHLDTFPEIKVVASTDNGADTLNYLKKNQVDVLFLDISMPNKDGLEVLRELKIKSTCPKIIMLSNFEEGWIIKKSVSLGCNGYISKTANSDELYESILCVMNGGTYFCKHSFANFMKSMSNGNGHDGPQKELSHDEASNLVKSQTNKPTACAIFSITKREKQVLNLIANGLSSKQISMSLYIAVRTVETHRKNMMTKLGVSNTAGLIKIGYESEIMTGA